MASPAAQLRASAEAKSRQTAVKASSTRNRAVTVAKSQASFTRESSTLLPQRVQTAMRVSSPNDPAEREASAVARNVVQIPVPSAGGRPKVGVGAARMASRMQSTLLSPARLQREGQGAAQAGPEVATEIRASLGGGMPLPQAVRDFMEPRFRADFGRVRIHTDSRAAGLAARLSARAFAYGQDIFFAKDAYSPESAGGRELIAHELTHTIQQRSAAPAKASRDVEVTQHTPPQVQRLGFDTALNYFADKANALPGFRMLTIVLGKNPINDQAVDASPGNVFRAIVEFIPGASLVTEALNNAGIFDKIANWAWGQLKATVSAFMGLGGAVLSYVKSLGAKDLLSPGAAIDRGIHLVTDPINQIKSLVAGFIDAILEFIKEAILRPLGKLAEGTESYDLLKGVMGEDPVTGDAVDNSAELMVGGFMKIIGQDEVWQNIQKSGALAKCWAWFQGAMGDLKSFVAEIPGLFMAGLKSLTLVDIIVVPLAFAKLAKVFGNFLGRFISWAGEAMWNLLEIVFKAVKPDAWEYIQKTGAALKSILQNPLPFLGNLVAAGKGGFAAFGDNFLTHLKKGLIDWLTGSLDGVYIPKALTLGEIVKFVFSVLGLTYARFRVKMVKAFGEPAVLAMEAGFRIVKTLVLEGPAAAWEQIKSELDALKDQVIEGIKGLVIEAVITKGIPKLIAMFIPGAGFIGAIISIYDTVMVIVNQVSKIIAVVKSFVDSIVAIANGNIAGAIAKVESVLATGLSLAINFFAAFAGLGKISAKINGVIQKIRAPVDKGMDSLINWVKTMAKKLFKDKNGLDPETEKKRVAGVAALTAVTAKYANEEPSLEALQSDVAKVKTAHPVFKTVTVALKDAQFNYTYQVNPTFPPVPGPVNGDNWQVAAHEAKRPPKAKKNAAGESHHVPAKVLASWVGDVFTVAGNAMESPGLKAKGGQLKANADGANLSAIWLSKKAHKAAHSRPSSNSALDGLKKGIQTDIDKAKTESTADEAKNIRILNTAEGDPTAKPGRATLNRELVGANVPAYKSARTAAGKKFRAAVLAKWSQMQPIITGAYKSLLASGIGFVKQATLTPKAGWEAALKALADATWGEKMQVPADDTDQGN